MKITVNESAYPVVSEVRTSMYSEMPNSMMELTDGGITIRQQFAMAAMQGLLTRVPKRPNGETNLGILECRRIAEESVIMADTMIAELNKEKQ